MSHEIVKLGSDWKSTEPPPEQEDFPTNENGKRICGAKRGDGRVCRATVLYPNGRCRMHGGPSLRGAASPRFKHGKYSKAMPQSLRDAYKRAEADPELLSLRSEVAVLQSLTNKALEDMSAESPPWEEAVDILQQLGPVQIGKVLNAYQVQAIEALTELVSKGADVAQAWEKGKKELKDCIERKTYTATAEHKRLHDQSLALPVEQAMAFATAVIEGAKAVIKPKDEQLYRELMKEISKLLPSRPLQRFKESETASTNTGDIIDVEGLPSAEKI